MGFSTETCQKNAITLWIVVITLWIVVVLARTPVHHQHSKLVARFEELRALCEPAAPDLCPQEVSISRVSLGSKWGRG